MFHWFNILPSSIFIVSFLSLSAFHISYYGDFVFDDLEAIVNNQDVMGGSVDDLFSHDFWGTNLTSSTSHKSYRPLTVLTFRLNKILAGRLDSTQFHLVNIILHCVVCLTFIVFVSIILGDGKSFTSQGSFMFCMPEVSTTSAVLFAVHPVHSESVAGVVGRADLLCALCFMMSFIFYVKAVYTETTCKKFTYYAFTAVLVLSSVLFKEPGLTVLGICGIYDVLVIRPMSINVLINSVKRFKRSETAIHEETLALNVLFRHSFLLILGLTIFMARWNLMGSTVPVFQPVDNPHSFINNSFYKMLNFNYIYAINGWLLFNPSWLCFDWSMGCVPIITSLTDYRILFICSFWIISAIISWRIAMLLQSTDRRRVMLGLSLIIIPFLPASNLLFRVGFVIAERNLYLPSMGFVILVALGVCNLYRLCPRLTSICFSVLVVTNVCKCLQRSADWNTELRLYSSALDVCPLNAKVHYNVAKIRADEGHIDVAIEMYREALRLHPTYDQAMNNLGNLYKDRGQLIEAQQLLNQAVIVRPEFAAAWMNLGIVQAALKQFFDAERSYRTALSHRRRYADCYYNLGNLYLETGRHSEALEAWNNATQLQPSHINAWTNSIILLGNLARYDELTSLVHEALAMNPTESLFHYHYASSMGKLGQFESSEKHFLLALENAKRTDNVASFHANLAVLYHRWGKLREAEEYYQTALRIDPSNNHASENYLLLRRKLSQTT